MQVGGGGPGAGASPRKRGKLRQAPRGTQERQKNVAAGIKSPLKRNKQPSNMESEDDSEPAPGLRAMLERQNTLRDMLAQNPEAGPTPLLVDVCEEQSLSDASIAFHHRKSVAEMQSVALLNLEGLLDDDTDDDESLDAFDLGNDDPACPTTTTHKKAPLQQEQSRAIDHARL